MRPDPMTVGAHDLTLPDFGEQTLSARCKDQSGDEFSLRLKMIEVHHVRGIRDPAIAAGVALQLGHDVLVAVDTTTTTHAELPDMTSSILLICILITPRREETWPAVRLPRCLPLVSPSELFQRLHERASRASLALFHMKKHASCL
jgi:hypothetical protein